MILLSVLADAAKQVPVTWINDVKGADLYERQPEPELVTSSDPLRILGPR